MLTFSSAQTLFGTFTNNSTATNLAFGNTFMNQYTLELIHKFPGIFTEQTFTNLQTYPSQQYYNVPANLRKIGTVVINVGNGVSAASVTGAGFNWPVKECPTRERWNNLNLTNNISSDIPQYYFFYNGQLGIYPKPASGYNPITITGQVEPTTLSVTDYTTGTISAVPYALTLTSSLAIGAVAATLTSSWTLPTATYELNLSSGAKVLALFTNASTAVTWTEALIATATSAITVRTANDGEIVTGSGTTWSTSMNGYVFQIATPAGDEFWYTIDTVYSTTMLSLKAPYNGLAITGGTASYIIGQASLVPQAYHYIPVYRASEVYYTIVSSDEVRASKYKALADSAEAMLRADYGNKDTDPTCDDAVDRNIINPNLSLNITQSGEYQ